jgi:hypothetical protein
VRVRAVAFALLGMIVAHVPIAIHYASHDELPALLRGYLLSRRGLDYVTFGTLNLADDALSEGVSALIFFLALPLAIAAFTAWPPRSRRDRAITLLAITWAAFAILGASIGFRFYKGYFLAALPPLCLLAAAPWGLSGTARGLRRWQRAALFVPIAFGVARQIVVLDHERDNRAVAHDLGGRKIADHVRANTTANDRIWIWGWHLWDVYSLADRLSGSRLYKSMNIITTDDDGNWRRARSPMKFVDGPAARRLLADLERSRPAYIVLGSTVPHREFAALGRFLRTHYRRDRRVRVGRVEFWQRRLSEGP